MEAVRDRNRAGIVFRFARDRHCEKNKTSRDRQLRFQLDSGREPLLASLDRKGLRFYSEQTREEAQNTQVV
eukprot:gene26181-biopygen14662